MFHKSAISINIIRCTIKASELKIPADLMQDGDPSWWISEDSNVIQTPSGIITNTDAYECASKLGLAPENLMHN